MEPNTQASIVRARSLIPAVYQELRLIARSFLRRQDSNFTLQPTELVNEACMQILVRGCGDCGSVPHFRAIATRKIWQVLVDHLRKRTSQKRDARRTVRSETGSIEVPWLDRTVDLIDLADTLDALAWRRERLREVIMLHCFGGLTYREVGEVLGVSASTAEKDFRFALAWVERSLSEGGPDERIDRGCPAHAGVRTFAKSAEPLYSSSTNVRE